MLYHTSTYNKTINIYILQYDGALSNYICMLGIQRRDNLSKWILGIVESIPIYINDEITLE